MPRGAIKSFTDYALESGEGDYNNTTDDFKWVIITESFTAIDADVTDPKLADFTQVSSSGNYVANTSIANTIWTKTGNTVTLNGDSFNYGADGANPTTGKSILIYNNTSLDKSALAVVDLTTDDGVTPADTTQGLTYNVNVNGIYRVVRSV